MTWGRMDDKAHRNRKVRKLYLMGPQGREAYGVWTFRWSWCLDSPDLDGFIPENELDEGERRSAELLCSDLHNGRGLWKRVAGGFVIHDFHEYNPTKKQRQKKLRADRERIAEKRSVARDSQAISERLASESHPRARAGHGMGTYGAGNTYSGSSEEPEWMDPPGRQTPAPDCLDESDERPLLRAVRP